MYNYPSQLYIIGTISKLLYGSAGVRRCIFSHWRLPFLPIWQQQVNTLSLTRELNHIFFFLFPRCTELNLIRCYITSVRGCLVNLIKKKQCVSPSLADSFTSRHLWEKTPLRRVLQPLKLMTALPSSDSELCLYIVLNIIIIMRAN